MKKLLFLALMLSAVAVFAQPSIIPQPVSLTTAPGNFTIDAGTSLKFAPEKTTAAKEAAFFAAYIKSISGMNMPVNKPSKSVIELQLANIPEVGNEGYKLNVSPTKIVVAANTTQGIFYGLQTIMQQLPPIRNNAPLTVPCMTVTDYPRFTWRGMHLDVSRHFFGPEIVKQYIDLLASYKLNTFHWHLLDDQGWRIEIKKYPKLTSVGAWRVDKNDINWRYRPQAQPGEPATYGGYYTQEQLKEIVQYAADRHVTIVPEIEMPGHVASAIAAYPELSCSQQPQLPLTGGNYTNMSSNYCAGNDSVFTFLENVLTEVMAIFPSKYIHIGGDEVEKDPWKKCPKCQARIKNENLKNEDELQSWFIKRMEKFLISKGRKMIGWDEILEGGLAPEATVMSWRGEAGGIEAAKMGHDVVMTPGNPLYFDHYQAGPEGEPPAIGGFNNLKKVYDYNPIPQELTGDKAKYVLGAQANVWCEFITSGKQIQYMVLPRMLALAEVVWSPLENKNWESFYGRLQKQFRAFQAKGLNYAEGNFTVDIRPVIKDGKLSVELYNEIPGSEIYYTMNGSVPTKQSTKYTGPIDINGNAPLRAVVVVGGVVRTAMPSQQNFAMHKAVGAKVTYINPPARNYNATGSTTLTNGIRGTYVINRHWHGFTKPLIATVDLGSVQWVQTIKLGCLQKYVDWIFMPASVKFEISTDGVNFEEVQTVQNDQNMQTAELIHDFVADFTREQARYIRVTAINNTCPPGHSGEGKNAWIFADEIVVE